MRFIKTSLNTVRLDLYYANLPNDCLIGTTTINSQQGLINNLYVKPDYRLSGFGSQLLRLSEDYLQNKHQHHKIELLAWQSQGCFQTIRFYQKNNYAVKNFNLISTYDDGEMIYDLIPMIKNLS